MTRAEQQHEVAMDLVDRALEARQAKRDSDAIAFLRDAFLAEKQAALEFQNQLGVEPTRSILLRSAASLALDCGETREAERLAAEGLRGTPPPLIEAELREVMERANFTRHLGIRGLKLAPVEFQFTVAGPAIAPGLAPAPAVLDRLQALQRILKRTAQRRRHEPFHEHPGKSDSDFELFLEAPRAASFAVTIRVGAPQLKLPGQADDRVAVVEEFLDCVGLAQSNDDAALRSRFVQTAGDSAEAYLANFNAIVEKLRPDGESVSLVGITRVKDGKEQQFDIKRKPKPKRQKGRHQSAPPLDEERVEVRGVLLYADSTSEKPEIRLKASHGTVKISVPEGLMTDIVRPYFDEEVVVVGRNRNGVIELEECRLASGESEPA